MSSKNRSMSEATYCKHMVYTRIKAEFAAYWGVSESTYFRVVDTTRTGASRWIEMNGERKSVPIGILTYPGP